MISILSLFNLISVLLSLTFQILLVKFFGAHLQTDVYYLSIAIVQFITGTFSGFLMDLYIPVYNEIKAKDEIKAKEFAGGVFILMLIISSAIAFLMFIFSPFFVKLFATGFSPEKIYFTSYLLKIFSIYIILNFLNLVLSSTLQANMYMSVPFFTTIFTPLFNIIALLSFSQIYGIKAVIYAMVFSSFFVFLILLFYYLKKIPVSFVNPLRRVKNILYLLKHNLPVRFGTIIWNLKSPITTNILSYFPTGYFTLFSYANRILATFFGITNSPPLQVLYVKVSRYLPENNIKKIKETLTSTLKTNTFLFIIPVFVILLIFKKLFIFLFHPKVSLSQINIMYYLFIFLVPYYLILSFEMPFVNITLSMKKGFKVFQIAIIFIIIYTLSLLSSTKHLNIYAIPVSLFIAQIYNTFSYSFFVNKKLSIVDREIIKNILQFAVFTVLLIFFNIFFEDTFFLKMLLNIILIILFSLTMKKEIFDIFVFLFGKREIK